MTKLEPTRTSSDLTATDRLRELLDERGVEWRAWDGTHPITVWHDETYLYEFIEYRLVNGAKQVSNCPSDNDGHCELTIKVFNCTPEQAIAATLGSCSCSNSERTDVPRLPYWWTHDGTLHVELPKLPESISVRLPDQRDREMGSARVWQYTRGSGTCEIHDCEGSFSAVNRPVWRCDCGAFMTQFTDATTYHKPRFCPNCGRKVVDE